MASSIQKSIQPQPTFSSDQSVLSSAWKNHKVAIITSVLLLTSVAIGGGYVASMPEDQRQACLESLSNTVTTFASNLFSKSNQSVFTNSSAFETSNFTNSSVFETSNFTNSFTTEKQEFINQMYAIAGKYCLPK